MALFLRSDVTCYKWLVVPCLCFTFKRYYHFRSTCDSCDLE